MKVWTYTPVSAETSRRCGWCGRSGKGAGTSSVRSLAAEFPFDAARRGYAVGSAVLDAVLPPHNGPTAAVPVETGDVGLETLDGIEAKRAVVDQLGRALEVIQRHSPARIVTLGGDLGERGPVLGVGRPLRR
jgi:arginase